MNDTNAESWLTQEAEDLLGQGTFGLYEFVWGLRGTDFELTDEQSMALAARVARKILDNGEAQIFVVSWPTLEVVEGPLARDVLNEPETWSPGESGRLMALVPTDR